MHYQYCCVLLLTHMSDNSNMSLGLHVKCLVFCIILMKPGVSGQMAVSNFTQIHCAGAELICAGTQTNVMKPVDTFCDCANTPTKDSMCKSSILLSSCLSVT